MNTELQSKLLRGDDLSRRQFVARAAGSLLGVGLLPGIFPSPARAVQEAAAAPARAATAKNVIYLYMSGGQSHLDTWDPKEGVDTAGPARPIRTSAAGVRVSEYLPLMARQMHRATVINSLTSTQGAHEQGTYYMHTSYTQLGTIRHPALGAWLNLLQPGAGNSTLPNFVYVGNDSRHPGAGFLPASHGPFFVNNPENGTRGMRSQSDRTRARLALAGNLDEEFSRTFPQRNVRAHTEMYDSAIAMMNSRDLRAFDLTQESAETRNAYGRDPNGRETFGQGCLLARRLIEHGVRFVEVSFGSWDTHSGNFTVTPELCATFDRAMSTLITDLHARDLLKDTLVVLATEFGRTPDINGNLGRDHYPRAFSGVLVGGGAKGGFVYGRTDREGREVVEDAVRVPDFNATIAYALGLPLDREILSPSQRPFTVAGRGRPVTALFA